MIENDPDTKADGESFVGRWARRKRESEAEPQSGIPDDVPASTDEDEAATELVADAPAESEPAKTDDDMPPIESIDERSNVGDFFSSGVSRELRRAALRRLFHLPKYNFRDGLNDYDADYRTFVPLGDTVTADMRLKQERLEEMARRLRDELEASNDDELAAQGMDENADADVRAANAEPDVDPVDSAGTPNSETPRS